MQNKNTEKNVETTDLHRLQHPESGFFSTKLSSLILTKNVAQAPPRAIFKKTDAR